MAQPHFLLITFPAQGHVNPSLRFAHRLIRTTNARVTFVTSISVIHRSMISKNHNTNLSFLTFSDGFDDGVISNTNDVKTRLINFERNGKKALSDFIKVNRNGESPVSYLIYTILPNWVPKLAKRFQIPSALLWIQPAFVFDVYYNHSKSREPYYISLDRDPNHVKFETKLATSKFPNESLSVEIAPFGDFVNLPSLAIRDLPSFIAPYNKNKAAQEVYEELMKYLVEEANPKILVNTFNSLEPEALKAFSNIEMVAVGPLLPDEIFRGIESVKDFGYRVWLDSKTESSVIYVSFGTMVELSKKQIEELARGLIEGKRPFLWVITDKANREAKIEGEEETEIEKIAGFRQELEEIGMIVSWCSQIEVLRHQSIGCFLTHCGWSSTLESLVLGVPVVAFPMWSDQPTNAKLLEECWKIGVRVRENGEGLVERGEIRRCLEAVMEDKDEEIRQNAEKWKRLAVEAGEEGGSSDKNIKSFVETLF